MGRDLNRRDFLRLTGAATGIAALAACAPGAPGDGTGIAQTEQAVIRFAGLANMGGTVEGFILPWLEDVGYGWERGIFGQQELTDKIMQSVATDTYLADVFQFPSNARSDVINANALYPIPDFVLDAIDFDDILPSIVGTLSWEGQVYSLPFDGDVHYSSFRKDLFADPAMASEFESKTGFQLDPESGAKTWDEWRAIAEHFTGWDWNGNGEEDDFGIATMNKRGDTLWWGFHSRATAYAKHPDDPSYFIDIDTGEARVNNPGFVRALTEWVEENHNWAPPGGTGFTYGDSLNAMNGGRVVQTYNWDAVTTAAAGEFSVIQGKQGYNHLPGSYEVYNHKEGGWESFEEPSAAPFLAFGGWVIAVSALTDDSVIEQVWNMAIELTKPESGLWFVTNLTGCSPYRFSQLEAVDEFANGPLQLGEEVAIDYLNAAKGTLDHPNAVTDQAFGGWVQYRDALELGVSKAMAQEADPQTAMDEVATAFNEISDRMGGKEHQAELYRLTLGL
jgi:multiple sugar transport system substrate-binding protein